MDAQRALRDLVGDWYHSNTVDNVVSFQDFGDDYGNLLNLVSQHRPNIVVEIGSYSGRSSAAIATLLQQWHGTLICIDTWLGNPRTWFDATLRPSLRMKYGRPNIYSTFCSNMINLGLSDTIIPLCQTSSNAAAILKQLNIDIEFVYWDSGHDQVGQDLALYLPLLSTNGIFVGDDLAQHAEISDQLNTFVRTHLNYTWQPLGQNNWKICKI